MKGELFGALESLEREKGISKEVLISAIKSALASAAYKIINDPDVAKTDINVEISKDGDIKIYLGEEEFRSEQFGRIAAQTAKQVMIQKIREAERDVVFEKYMDKQGTIVSGAVHRFEKGNIVIELDDAEAILPRSEQILKEKFRQGQTLRACIKKIERKTGGLDIILSRASSEFVKKLFELEVPEISQGIVEIRGIARDPGERTKIAVSSNDSKIDAMGACVGVKGARVKEIVQELSGERIDVIRWSPDINEYVQAALSPIEIYSLEVDRENKNVKVTVPKNQLALLIGKKGRNIRLASELLGWEVEADAMEGDYVEVPIDAVDGLDKDTARALKKAGLKNAHSAIEAGIEGLTGIKDINEEKAKSIILSCENALKAASIAIADASLGGAPLIPETQEKNETTDEGKAEEPEISKDETAGEEK
ncbi:MAG: transcription termination factor NusA [Candidatus Omnitrophica bacterium]|nr:transcription termination factor NusA [Candidatus Omnitrophota bacterium]